MEMKLATVAEENTSLKLTNLQSRSCWNNIRIVGLPKGIESPQPTVVFSQLLLEVFGEHILELDQAHRMLAGNQVRRLGTLLFLSN